MSLPSPPTRFVSPRRRNDGEGPILRQPSSNSNNSFEPIRPAHRKRPDDSPRSNISVRAPPVRQILRNWTCLSLAIAKSRRFSSRREKDIDPAVNEYNHDRIDSCRCFRTSTTFEWISGGPAEERCRPFEVLSSPTRTCKSTTSWIRPLTIPSRWCREFSVGLGSNSRSNNNALRNIRAIEKRVFDSNREESRWTCTRAAVELWSESAGSPSEDRKSSDRFDKDEWDFAQRIDECPPRSCRWGFPTDNQRRTADWEMYLKRSFSTKINAEKNSLRNSDRFSKQNVIISISFTAISPSNGRKAVFFTHMPNWTGFELTDVSIAESSETEFLLFWREKTFLLICCNSACRSNFTCSLIVTLCSCRRKFPAAAAQERKINCLMRSIYSSNGNWWTIAGRSHWIVSFFFRSFVDVSRGKFWPQRNNFNSWRMRRMISWHNEYW